MSAILWALAIVLIAVGIAGTVLPALPGPVLVFGGMLLGAWAGGFERVGVATLILLAIMTVAAYLIDLAATVLGVQRSGASTRAVFGAAIGLLGGIPFGLPGLLIGGGILGHVRALLERSEFRARFEDKGRFAGYLGGIGTALIARQQPALAGLVYALQHSLPSLPVQRL